MATKAAAANANHHNDDDLEIPELDVSKLKRPLQRGKYAKRVRFTAKILRESLDLTQVEVAERAGMTQSEISKLEQRRDWLVSSLERYARALGGTLRVAIRINDRDYELAIDHEASTPTSKPARQRAKS